MWVVHAFVLLVLFFAVKSVRQTAQELKKMHASMETERDDCRDAIEAFGGRLDTLEGQGKPGEEVGKFFFGKWMDEINDGT